MSELELVKLYEDALNGLDELRNVITTEIHKLNMKRFMDQTKGTHLITSGDDYVV